MKGIKKDGLPLVAGDTLAYHGYHRITKVLTRVRPTYNHTQKKCGSFSLGALKDYELSLVPFACHSKLAVTASRYSTVVGAALPRALPRLRGTIFHQRLQRFETARGGKGATRREASRPIDLSVESEPSPLWPKSLSSNPVHTQESGSSLQEAALEFWFPSIDSHVSSPRIRIDH